LDVDNSVVPDDDDGRAHLYFAWHMITISVFGAAVTSLALQKTATSDKDIERSCDGAEEERVKTGGDREFSSLRCGSGGPGTASTLVSVVSRAASSNLDESFLQKQMPVYSNTLVLPPPSGLSVLPKNGGSGLMAATTDFQSSWEQQSIQAPAPPPAGVSTPADLASSESSSSTRTAASTPTASEAMGPVLAVPTVPLASPAPSTASTATCPPGVGITWPQVVESEPVDRISPIEEYNTLCRHIQSVRASIKLKESRII
jgi:hypothetical protein